MKTILILKNSYLTLSSENKQLINTIYDTLTFNDTSKAFINGRFDKNRVTKVRIAKVVEDTELPTLKIPIGFRQFIESVLNNYDYSLIDDRPTLKKVEDIDKNVFDGIELHEHQLEALKKALHERRGIVKSPPGTGKTEIFLAILKLLNEPTLVLFNRTQLTHQTMKRAKDRGIDAGIVQGKNVDEKFVSMATIQSIEKAEDIKRYKNLIIDEVHYASSKSYQRVLRLNHWRRVYGFSATPVDPEKMDLNSAKIIANVGPVIYSANTDQLIEKKIIAKPKIFMIKVDKPYNLEDSDYRTAELLGIVHNKQRNKLVKAIADMYSEDKVLILTKYVKQGEEIKKLIPEAPFIWNKTKLEKRIEIVDKFDNGDSNILIASRILDEGIDIKNFKILIVASAGNKFTKTIQRLGRGLRVTEDKKEVKVFDFIDDTHNTLYKHSKNRIKIYKSFGYDDITTLEDF
jgi:superfamily II DNA or RNA helicase